MIKVISIGFAAAIFSFFVATVVVAQTSTPSPTTTPAPTSAPGAPNTGFGG